ncbi:MAG: FHA domain-containing protein [Sedimentisphaerales bacterium]|nr:FHA domain-containing protein [Sedimentisphaerales bacterium]
MPKSIHLTVKRNYKAVNELTLDTTPIYIGRKPDVDVVLPDMAISRQHAMIDLKSGKWTIEDLDSANKTYLNCEAIHKAKIKSGDVVQIADFTIEIELLGEDEIDDKFDAAGAETVPLDQPALEEEEDEEEDETSGVGVAEAATLSTPRDEVVVRKPDREHAPAMRLAARRLTDFAQAVESFGKAKDLDELVKTIIDTSIQQFTAFRVWCGLRSQKTGPITFQFGKRRDGQPVELNDIMLNERITQTFQRGQSLVLPQVSAEIEAKERIRSAMIASIKTTKGCFGVLYVDNAMVHKHYSLSDLDYLMVVAIHSAGIIKNFL